MSNTNNYTSIKIRKNDAETLKRIKQTLKCKHLYDVISELIKIYERLEMLQHYLGCETVQQLFYEIEEQLPKSKKQLIIAKTNKYLDELKKIGVSPILLDRLMEAISSIIFKEGRFDG